MSISQSQGRKSKENKDSGSNEMRSGHFKLTVIEDLLLCLEIKVQNPVGTNDTVFFGDHIF